MLVPDETILTIFMKSFRLNHNWQSKESGCLELDNHFCINSLNKSFFICKNILQITRPSLGATPPRVLARIFRMPIQNSISQISARPDLATTLLLQILIPTTFDSLLCQIGKFTPQPCPRRWFVRKRYGYYPKRVKIENYS